MGWVFYERKRNINHHQLAIQIFVAQLSSLGGWLIKLRSWKQEIKNQL